MLTTMFELKTGDLIVTLPIAVLLLVLGVIACVDKDVGGSGSPPTFALLIVFAFAVRNNSVLLTATGIPFERALVYHKLFAFVAWFTAGLHGIAYLRDKNNDPEDEYDDYVVTGFITFGALTLLVLLSFYLVRRYFFELFIRFHWILFLVVLVVGSIHGASLMLVGFVPWVLDALYRYGIRSRHYARQQESEVSVTLATRTIVRVQFPRGDFSYQAGQYVFLCVPSVAKLEWHPFSIASASHEPTVTIYIKVVGDWTKKLASLAAREMTDDRVSVLIDGPYGALSVEMDHYSHFVFISGGIGVTPVMSVANTLFYDTITKKPQDEAVKKAQFLWSTRERETVGALLLQMNGVDPRDDPIAPGLWLSPALAHPSRSNSYEFDRFVADIFITRQAQDLSDPIDQQLGLYLQHNKRLDIEGALCQMGELAAHQSDEKPARVAVFVCGPKSMISDVLNASTRLSKTLQRVVFDVHSEVFEL